MANQNKIFTTLNQPLFVGIYSITNLDPNGEPTLYSTLEGLPLGSSDNSQDGELGVKVVVVGQRGDANNGSFQIPTYDTVTYTYFTGTNNIQTAVYSLAGNTVKTLTFTYAGGGTGNNDLVTSIAAS